MSLSLCRSSLNGLGPLVRQTNTAKVIMPRATCMYGPPRFPYSVPYRIGLFSCAMVIITGPMLWITAHIDDYAPKAE